MVYISNSGTYLIDRRMVVTRVQMRFPLWLRQGSDTEDMVKWMQKFVAGRLEKPSRVHPTMSPLHHGTLVDGEMVVNELPDGTKQRTFYMYDLMMMNGVNVVGLPWKVCALRCAMHCALVIHCAQSLLSVILHVMRMGWFELRGM